MDTALDHITNTLIALKNEVKKDIIGQDLLIEKLIITIFAGGHALLEGVPGLGKTKTIRTLAHALALPSRRVSFTPDLLPSDLTGAEIFRPGKGEFIIRKGPIFTNILLADELNRTPPKVQSALLEAMEEKQVTIAEETLVLPSPFVVFATENPLEHEGTYPLPEAELDRFLMRIILDYPDKTAEKEILIIASQSRHSNEKSNEKSSKYTPPSAADILEMITYIEHNVRIDDSLYVYVTEILDAYRSLVRSNAGYAPLAYGPSTRAGIALLRTARILAILRGRDYVLPEDIKALAHDVFDHRIGLSYEAESDAITIREITNKILDTVKILS